jgi:hypothetical protein
VFHLATPPRPTGHCLHASTSEEQTRCSAARRGFVCICCTESWVGSQSREGKSAQSFDMSSHGDRGASPPQGTTSPAAEHVADIQATPSRPDEHNAIVQATPSRPEPSIDGTSPELGHPYSASEKHPKGRRKRTAYVVPPLYDASPHAGANLSTGRKTSTFSKPHTTKTRNPTRRRVLSSSDESLSTRRKSRYGSKTADKTIGASRAHCHRKKLLPSGREACSCYHPIPSHPALRRRTVLLLAPMPLPRPFRGGM